MHLITGEVNLVLLRRVKHLMHIHPQVSFSFYNECKPCIENKISWKWDLFHPRERSHTILAESFKQSIQLPLSDHILYFTHLKEHFFNFQVIH